MDIYFKIFRLPLNVENSINKGEGLIKKNKVGRGCGTRGLYLLMN